MGEPLVSIVIATYQSRRDHLSAAILSALDQSWQRIEVIVTDDSPDDALRGFVAGFRDERLRYRRNEPRLGVAANHWAAFAAAQGEYIAVLNHDDWLAPRFVERLLQPLRRTPTAALAFCDHWVIDVRGRRLDAETERTSAAWGRAGLAEGLHLPFAGLVSEQTIPMAMGALFRRAALPARLPGDAGAAYDLWLGYLLCCSDGGAWYVSERLSAWRSHEANLTSQSGVGWLQGSAAAWSAMARDRRFAAVRGVVRHKAALGYYACAVRAWVDGHRRDCARFALRSLVTLLTLRGLAACCLPLLPRRFAPSRWLRHPGAA